jgi:hypothetical protein
MTSFELQCLGSAVVVIAQAVAYKLRSVLVLKTASTLAHDLAAGPSAGVPAVVKDGADVVVAR